MSTYFRISELRKESGMTQVQLAKAMGLSTSTVGMWESRARKPSSSILPQLAGVLGCTIDELYVCGANQSNAKNNRSNLNGGNTMGEEKKTAPKIPALRRQLEERIKNDPVRKFTKVILERASEDGLCVRELEEACNRAIRLCREASVPTLESLQRDRGN